MDEYNKDQSNGVNGGNEMPNGEYHFVPPRQNQQPQNSNNANYGAQQNRYAQPTNGGQQYYQNTHRSNTGSYYTPNNQNMYNLHQHLCMHHNCRFCCYSYLHRSNYQMYGYIP